MVLAEAPGQQCRVGVRLIAADRLAEPAVIAVLSEWLGAATGLLVQRMRKERGIAYGSMAQAQEQSGATTITLAVSGLRQDLPAIADGLRSLVEEVDVAEIDPDELVECGERVRHKLLAELDSPFGRLDDVRRVRGGGRPLATVIEDLPAAAVAVGRPGRVGSAPIAVGYVGQCDAAALDLIARMR